MQRKQLSEGTLLKDVKFSTAIGVLRDASVAAILNVFDYMQSDKGRKMVLMVSFISRKSAYHHADSSVCIVGMA